MRRRNILKLIVLVLAVAAAVALSIPKLSNPTSGIPLGLDLRGGVHLVLQAQPGANGKPITKDDMDKAKAIIAKRVNELGVSEPVVQADYQKDRIIVDLAGIKDPNKAVEVLKTTAQLTIRDPKGKILMQGDELKDAQASQDPSQGYVVNLTFTPAGAQKFAAITKEYLGQRIGIYLDNRVLTDPKVNVVIPNGQAEITGYSTLQDAANDAVLMRSGALPVSMTIAEKREVGASLGVDSLHRSINAGIYGLAFIFLFMLVFYRLPGVVADFSLIVYALIVLWVLWLFHAVLTLEGIAGFILSIGMAVDFNIIIYERVKEEIRLGKSLRAAVESGFSRAFITVIDAHVTTLITAVTLYVLGTGTIQGFALTLGIGILASLFTAITFTRTVLRWVVGINPQTNTRWYGVRREA
ncbi:Protein translocase subunit SecD [secD] [Acididesulfobacillus acetoxydans]|uniref:Protein translocase subunit SecD n=1 Tax=Acididesulfobacillus acetoxydans TaxID=1561005 RepID=A0A8S0WYV4_9FIRM|nr:protein translocase subunit SecD [Acididesulfobacillus acetoxydans]CAA7601691.1 Protein translocase subunit SecD [secD] [Acididesulfobacillus acetoxydans]CEJ09090.1 Protein translocase subunit SecD [Acididesulfobacillus acetoxydans]